MKGDISVYGVFIVILIGVTLFVIIAIAYKWVDNILPAQSSQYSCNAKLLSYCTDWFKNNFENKPDWVYGDKNPKECYQFTKVDDSGPSITTCKELLGVK